MKTTLTAIFTFLITISFSQETENTYNFVTNEDGVIEVVNITLRDIEDTLKVEGDFPEVFTLVILNKAQEDFLIGENYIANNDSIIFESFYNDYYYLHIISSTGKLIIAFTNANTSDLKENVETTFSLYPNPTLDFLNISGENIETIKVFNTRGQLVLSKKNYNSFGTTKLDVTTLDSGVYMVMVNNRKPIRFIKR